MKEIKLFDPITKLSVTAMICDTEKEKEVYHNLYNERNAIESFTEDITKFYYMQNGGEFVRLKPYPDPYKRIEYEYAIEDPDEVFCDIRNRIVIIKGEE